jgi:hydroxyacylglutathione hydrolase
LVLLDRDGSLAMAVGGILSQKTQRPIKVLYGGLEAYWNESFAPLPPVSSAPAAAPIVKPSVPAPSATTPLPSAPKTSPKKSAGC